jgi:hypothetical protein
MEVHCYHAKITKKYEPHDHKGKNNKHVLTCSCICTTYLALFNATNFVTSKCALRKVLQYMYIGYVWIATNGNHTKILSRPRTLVAVWTRAKKLARPTRPPCARVIFASARARWGRGEAPPKNWRGSLPFSSLSVPHILYYFPLSCSACSKAVWFFWLVI